MPVMHQAVKAFLANQRQGNASTKIRKYVTGGNQKPWKQKGTGRARAGLDARAALGGRRHGLRTDPAQLRAVRAAPGARARPQERAQRPRSRERDLRHRRVQLRRAEDVAPRRRSSSASASPTRKCSSSPTASKPNVFLSGRNLPTVHVMPYSDVSTYHILWSDVVLIEVGRDRRRARRRWPSATKRRAPRSRGERADEVEAGRRRRPRKKAAAPKAAEGEGRREEGAGQEGRREEAGARKKPRTPRRRGSNQCRHYIAPSCAR